MNKGGSGARRPKTGPRGHPPPGDFIALGNRSSRVSESELKPLQPLKPPQPLPSKKPGTTSLSERKRDSTTSLASLGVAKRPKLSSPTYPPHSLKAGDGEGSKRPGPSTQSPLLGQVTPIEVTPSELEEQVIDAEANGIKSRVDALLLGAIKNLKSNRVKPDPMMYMSLLFLAKSKPDLFMSRRVIEALTSILKREGGSLNIKPSKGANVLVPIMACNILLYAFSEEEDWPESFVKVYVEDALGDRVWVDNEHCRSFVENIWTAFGTRTVPRTLSRQHSDPSGKQPHSEQAAAGASQAAAPPKEEEEVVEEVETSSSLEEDYISVIPRFTSASVEHNIQTYILELVHDQLTRRQPLDSITRNLLKLLTVTCGYSQIRLLVSQRLEMWLQNPKLTRPAQELLMSLALNCNSHSNEDVEVISNLIRMRMKTKPLANHYVACIKELVDQHPENLGTLLKYVIYNELSTTRNPNNMSLLSTIFQSKQEKAAKLLAMVFQDLLTNKEDYLRASRALLREIVRALRHELDFVGLCRGFMKERTESQFKDLDAPLKDRLLLSLTDLISMTTFLSITSGIKEAFTAAARGEKKDLSVLHEFQKTVSTIQRDAVWWLHVVVPKMFNPNGKDFLACLNRVLFLEPVESYTGKDNWPAENDRGLLLSIVSEVPVQEDTLMRTIIIGLSNELPLTAPETLEIADSLVRRAAAVKMPSAWMQENSALSVSRLELLDAVLNLCAYHHPKDIALPHGYTAPKLAIGNLYWKGWILLAIVASLNPSTIGQSGWENFPMLKCLMEMLMTNNFTFPPPTAAVTSEDKDQILAQDAQLAQVEKEEILEFEAHLAAATTGVNITEGNSLLLSQLISMDPVGPARRPPLSVIDQLKATNKSLRLGQMLCRSRSPDFLLDIIQRQGASQSMPWLAELVQSSEGSLDVLPVQCLCEFLLLEKTGDAGNEESDNLGKELRDKRIDIQKHVLGRLRFLLFGADADAESTVEVLEYFMRRLSSVQTVERDSAVKGLELVLSQETVRSEDHVTVVCGEDEEGDAMVTTLEELSSPSLPTVSGISKSYQWLLVNLQTLPHFDTVRATCCFALRQSCQVEIIPERLQAYLVFLADHAAEDNEEEFLAAVIDISQLIIERPTIMNAVLGEQPGGEDTYQALLKLYSLALEEAMEAQDRVCSWEMSEQLFVQWSKDTEYAGKAATLHVMIIHAMIVLLTYGEPQGDTSLYAALLDAWCPERGHVKVYLTDTGDEAILLHEWLRLRMIRSHVPRVVDAALDDLLPSQLVLFAQSFGIPVDSMSKLLQQLDVATEEDAVALEESVLDKGYMAQLVEVQQLRGAVGGDAFCCLLCEPPVRKESADLEALDGGIAPLPLGDLLQSSNIKESPMSVDESEIEPQVTDAILESFISPGTVEPAEQRRLENRVQKVLTREVISANRGEIQEDSCLAEHLIEKLNEILDSADGQRLVNGMFDNSAFSCSLLRLLMSRQTALKRSGIKGSGLVTTIRKLSAHKLKGGPLSSAILQYRKQLGISEQKQSGDNILEQLVSGEGVDHVALVRQFLTAAKDCVIKPEFVSVDAAVKACVRLKKERSPLFEDFVKAIFTILITQNCKKNLTAASTAWSPQQSLPLRTCAEILVELLKDSDNSRDHLANGLYVDWYEIMDPEIVHIHPLLQRQLLFRDRARVPSWDRSVTSREDRSPSSYLLGLLTHQASWDTLQDCLDWLLGLEDVANSLNPTAALDFIWTCFHIPRLWQGRDQKSAAVGSQQHAISAVYEKPLLNLAASQISALTGIILSEISSTLEDWCLNKDFDFKQFLEEMKDETFTGGEEKRENIELFASRVTGRRLQLISLCCHGDKKKLQPVVSYILKSKRWSQRFSAEFLVQLYLAQPSVVRWIKDFRSFFNSGNFSQCSRCQLDVLCHRILTSLADSKPGKEYEDRAYNCSLLLRKLACDHPMLLLRHLPMIAAQLRGRVHLKSKEFTNQQHLLVFSHVLGLMDLLRPHIFKPDKLTQEGLRDTLEAYFSLLQAGCLHNKELAAVVAKFMTFLHHFCAESPDQAFATLHCKSIFFHELLQDFPSLPSLQCVVGAISIPSSTPSVDTSTQDLSSGESTPPTPPRVRSLITPPESVSWTSSQLASSVQRLAPSQPVDDVLKVLVDLDETSKRRVDILEHFVPHLTRLLHDSNVSCRTQAHMLLLRHIRQNPSLASNFVDTYLECLNSSEADVVSTAGKYLPEFVVLSSEYSSRLLQKMFSLAVYDSLDLGGPLLHSVQLLNLD